MLINILDGRNLKHFIQEYQSHISLGNGYNVSRGGSTSPKTQEWIDKVQAKRIANETTNKGMKRSEESKKKQSASLKEYYNRIGGSPLKGKLSNRKNYKHSTQTKEKLSATHQGPRSWRKGIIPTKAIEASIEARIGKPNWRKGKSKLSQEQKEAIRNDPRTCAVLAQEYNCGPAMISLIKRGIQ